MDENVNTQVRDSVAHLEQAAKDPDLIVDQHLLDRLEAMLHSFARLRREGPQRLRQARFRPHPHRPRRAAS